MARTDSPKEGTTFRLTGPLGVGAGSLIVGQEVRVLALVPADEKGAHDNTEDSVVVAWDEPSIVIGDDGRPGTGTATRHVSIGASQFSDLFEEA